MGSGGTEYVLISVVCSCLASILSEWVLKPKYSPANAQRFYLQKVRLEVWGILTSAIVLGLITNSWITYDFVGWDWALTLSLAMRVVQSWMAGLLAKHLSTVAKAVIQCLSLLIVFFFGDVVVFKFGVGSLPLALLAVVVSLSSLLYQMGRQRTVFLAKEQHALLQAHTQPSAAGDATAGTGTGRSASLPPMPQRSLSDTTDYGPTVAERLENSFLEPEVASCFMQDAQALAPHEFESEIGSFLEPPRERRCACPRLDRLRLVDRAWLDQAWEVNTTLAQWASSRAGAVVQLLCVGTFVLSDAGRTLLFSKSINHTPIVSQTLVAAMSGASIVIGVAYAFVADGAAGVRAAMDPKEALQCLPVAFFFSVGTTCQVLAYGVGINGVQNTVIGYSYMPLSAVLSRWIFHRAYSQLEWLALVLLVLSASSFVLLTDNGSGGGSMPISGVILVLASVFLSCLGSILAEKFMKAGQHPFYIQKVHLEVGGLLTAGVMLGVVGEVSDRDIDAFWKYRPVNGKMDRGLFVGWTGMTVFALVVTLLQSWLGGLVAKRLSTVTRAVAQCVSLLIIYFFGNLVLDHQQFDWPVGSMAIVVALTVQVFSQAGHPTVKRHEEHAGEHVTPQAQGVAHE